MRRTFFGVRIWSGGKQGVRKETNGGCEGDQELASLGKEENSSQSGLEERVVGLLGDREKG